MNTWNEKRDFIHSVKALKNKLDTLNWSKKDFDQCD